MHAFWRETDAGAQQMEMVQFNKDISLAGAAGIPLGLLAGRGSDDTGPLLGL